MTYAEAKARKHALETAEREANQALKAFDASKNGMGLTPDAVKATPEWKAAMGAYNRAFQALREFNDGYFKMFKAEEANERAIRQNERIERLQGRYPPLGQ